MRPIFKNEVLAAVNGNYNAVYDISHSGGVLTNAKISLKNGITTPGTPHNADNMNNLFDFDNLDSMRGNTRITVFNANGSTTESIKNTSTGIVNAKRETSFPNDTIVEVVTVYDDSGAIVLRRSTKTTTFNADGSVTEVIE